MSKGQRIKDQHGKEILPEGTYKLTTQNVLALNQMKLRREQLAKFAKEIEMNQKLYAVAVEIADKEEAQAQAEIAAGHGLELGDKVITPSSDMSTFTLTEKANGTPQENPEIPETGRGQALRLIEPAAGIIRPGGNSGLDPFTAGSIVALAEGAQARE